MLLLAKLAAASVLFCFLAGGATVAALRNVTIDDQFGDELSRVRPTYSPTLGWTSGGAGAVKLDTSLVHNGTWHDTTLYPGGEPKRVNFTFTGISLYVYCIIANTPPGPPFFDADADYKFLIDGELVGRYTHEAELNIPDYFYNTPVYVNTTLQNKAHNFTLLVDSPAKPVLLLFDYAVYTSDEDTVQSSATESSTALNQPTETPGQSVSSRTQVNVGVIVGPVIGGLSLITVILAALLFRRRRKARNAQVLEVSTPSPKVIETGTQGSRGSSEARDPDPEPGPEHEGDLVQEMREMRRELQRLRQQSAGTPPPYAA
ncbi:hypothetical protein CCMSSC00406_0006776 [Pleurotus cornucopiae]|uniref:Uncharacterized protein n=1 Tax=Pleurotus cornucopiae TaxID=5321 RepID=A0ACB7J0P3_PLECO|nr:hypothetical protein CCMSSC00406_0006776 [Pleurotus cornucopiae]